MYCPVCGEAIEDDKEQFCKYCKAGFSEKPNDEASLIILCPNCNKEMDVRNGDVSFCKFCGSELIEESINEQTTVIACPHCNKEIGVGHGEIIIFCKYCGSNISMADEMRIIPKYCRNCGKEIDKVDNESEFCKYCGVKFGEAFTSNQPKFYKSPGLAIFLSFLWTGAGQLYNGEIAKGMILVIITLILCCLCFIPGVALVILVPILIYWIFGMVDANRSAKRINNEIAFKQGNNYSSDKEPDFKTNSIPEQIEQLSKLKEKGILTEAEFEEKKKELLSKI